MSERQTNGDIDQIESREAGVGTSLLRIGGILARPELARWRFRMALALLLTVTAKLFAVSAPVFFGEAINQLEAGEIAFAVILSGVGLWVGARFLSTAFPQLRDALFAPVSQDAQRIIAVDAFGHAQSLSLRFHQTRRTGALNRVVERGAAALDFLLRFLAFNIGPTLIELAIAAAVLGAVYDINLAFAALATVFAYGVFTLTVTEWRVKQRRRLNEADTELKARAIDSLTNFETVKAFAAEERETSRYDAALQSYNVRYVETSRSLSLMNAGQELIMNIGLLSVAGLAAWGAYQGRLGVGDVTAVVLMLSNLYRPLNILGWAWREIKQGGVDLEKLYGLLGMAAEVTDRPDAKPLTIANGEVRFEGVGFSHADRSAGLIDVDFIAPGGGKLALVGASGSGKSTLLKLLFRFYDVQRGRVSIDGQNVGDVTQSSLRNALGLVPQDVVLFNTTIADNISYAKPNATPAELKDAARRAQLLEFIEGLPQAWETRVGERGVKLSGGEKQRLGIARAILNDPPILVLDEATSALDSGTEEDVQQALNAASHGRTTLVVAHRLSTIADADEIIVLDAGRVVERGDHQSLIAKDGAYAKMWERQAKNSDQSVVETAAQ